MSSRSSLCFVRNGQVTLQAQEFFEKGWKHIAEEMLYNGYTPEVDINFVEWCFLGWYTIISRTYPNSSKNKRYRYMIQIHKLTVWRWFKNNYMYKIWSIRRKYQTKVSLSFRPDETIV